MITISHSEASSALDCAQQWAFRYRDGLKPRTTHLRLRRGSAWDAAMKAYHSCPPDAADEAYVSARFAMMGALGDQADKLAAAGEVADEEYLQLRESLGDILTHYTANTAPIGLTPLDSDLVVSIPSLTGVRASNRYKLDVRFDGIKVDQDGDVWIVEFKLRDDLSTYEQVVMSRQTRWYAWAYARHTGRRVAGVIVDERRAIAPKPARILASGKTSQDKNQLTTAAIYAQSCTDTNTPISPDVVDALNDRRWQDRHVVAFTDLELAEAGRQVQSTARLIRLLASGELYPTRNPNPMRCPGCAFRPICNTPDDTELVDALYTRHAAKHTTPEKAIA